MVREDFYYVCFVVFFTISKHCFLKSKKKNSLMEREAALEVYEDSPCGL